MSFGPDNGYARTRSCRRSLFMTGAILGLCLLLVGVAEAGPLDAYRGFAVKALKLEGLPQEASAGWERGLALKPRRQLLGKKKVSFSPRLLRDDIRRLRLQLARIGYPRAEIVPRAEAVDAEARELDLILEIRPGNPVVLADVQVRGWPERLAAPDSLLRDEVASGERFADKRVAGAERRLEIHLMDSGYELAQVRTQVQFLSADRAQVVYAVEAGPYSRIDSLRITGCGPDLVGLARRVMALDLPMDYSAGRLERASRDLRLTQLFQQVSLETENREPGHLLLHAKLQNARMRVWRAGVGTWSDNPWLVRAGWTHRNFFHRGVGLEVDGRLGAYERALGARAFWLGWWAPDSRTSLGLSLEQNDEEAYFSREEKLSLTHLFGQRGALTWKTGISFSLVDVDDHDPLAGNRPDAQGPMLEFWVDLMGDFTDTPTAPTRGFYYKLSGVVAPAFLGVSEAPYASLQLDAAAMRPLPRGIIATSRLRLGGSHLLGDAPDLLATRRFYAGGFNTMRGYKRRHLGPDDAAADPRGGQFTLLAGAELRFPLVWRFDGAVFCDAGQVWRRRRDVVLGDLSGAVGLALDLRTPIGPIRVNYARNVINRLAGEGRDLFSVGVGYPW